MRGVILASICCLLALAAGDEGRYFPAKDRVSLRVVADHVLGGTLAPGGTVGEYRNAKGAYQLGLIHLASSEKAAFFLLDVKKVMGNAKYLAHMGGYQGVKDGKPFYVFAKGPYVAFVSGLEYEPADLVARTFATRIP